MKNVIKFSTYIIINLYFFALFSCGAFNLFSWSEPTTDELLASSIDELIHALYRADVIAALSRNSADREKMIEQLEARIENSRGKEKIKTQMALSAVISKTTELNQVIYPGNTATLLDLIQGKTSSDGESSYRDLFDQIFKNTNKNDITAIIRNALVVNNILNDMGDGIQENNTKFPDGFDDRAGDFVEQALLTGSINALVVSVHIANENGDTVANPTEDQKIEATAEYIANRDSTTRFYNTVSFSEHLIGSPENPTGARIILEAGGFSSIIEAIDANSD